ncbi:MAG: hypothetical protein IJC68_03475 [Firmicutes bacterium]|nr:hypothetical protein [Bacillota bacterium]
MYDETLRNLKEKVLRQKQLSAMLKELYRQQEEYSIQAADLEEMMEKEQADVDRLTGNSLAAFFYEVLGKREEKLAQEERDALAARVKYESAYKELQTVQKEIRQYEEELDSLQGSAKQYEKALEEKKAALRAAGSPAGQQLLRMEEQVTGLKAQKHEVQEALAAGNEALETAYQVAEELSTASDWGVLDMFNGGLVTDLVKHSHLDEAQALIELLQSQLRAFRTELADVPAQSTFQVNIAGFLRFADYFFDGLFADWTVQQHIRDSQAQVGTVIEQIRRTLERLESLENTLQNKREELEKRIAELAEEE